MATAEVATRYFDALNDHDLDRAVQCWAPGRRAAHAPHSAFNDDTERARHSIRKLAALEPPSVWPGHTDPVTGDVAAQLKRAASA